MFNLILYYTNIQIPTPELELIKYCIPNEYGLLISIQSELFTLINKASECVLIFIFSVT